MSASPKDQKALLQKLNIKALNPMQEDVQKLLKHHNELILLSPTGSGKTLAYLLAILERVKIENGIIQALIIVPTRELAIQVESVLRQMGTGHKVNAIYGGRSNFQDKMDLKQWPSILIATPGRLLDHIKRRSFDINTVHTLVLDEFDKSLEIGFAKEMEKIILNLSKLKTRILCSATALAELPEFVNMPEAKKLDFLATAKSQLSLRRVIAEDKDKLKSLVQLLSYLGNSNGIVFCNFRDTIDFVSDHLYEYKLYHSCFFGGMEQSEREESLIKFRNGSTRILLATDLAARGIDVPELDYIIHYQLPREEASFIHRNGRTARMNAKGMAYALQWKKESVPPFLEKAEPFNPPSSKIPDVSKWCTLAISAGRRDKISKGDIAGFFFKKGQIKKEDLGVIELSQTSAYVAVPYKSHRTLIEKLNNQKLKTKKVRIALF